MSRREERQSLLSDTDIPTDPVDHGSPPDERLTERDPISGTSPAAIDSNIAAIFVVAFDTRSGSPSCMGNITYNISYKDYTEENAIINNPPIFQRGAYNIIYMLLRLFDAVHVVSTCTEGGVFLGPIRIGIDWIER